jgi:hypothetical protein
MLLVAQGPVWVVLAATHRSGHQKRRWRTLFRRRALDDLFGGPYA